LELLRYLSCFLHFVEWEQAWDARTLKPSQTYAETHTDHITSFLPLPNINPHHVLCTSGDCTLSILDLRKSSAVATSEDQEDELLCSAFAQDTRRICVGTQSGFITVWKSGEWMDHVDRIAPAERLRKGDEAPSIDCLVQRDEEVIIGASDGTIRKLGFRPNKYGDMIGTCGDGLTSLVVVPHEEDWLVSASGTKVTFWKTNETHSAAEDDESSDEEKRKKKRKKKSRRASGDRSTFFADL
jgi:WD repeat-containing protein 55